MTRLLVTSDIHSNLSALEAVLNDAQKHGPYDRKYCTGDVVGYGPFPNEVIQVIRHHQFITIQGNHDRAVFSGNFDGLTRYARAAAIHNHCILSDDSREFLSRLGNSPHIDRTLGIALVHGSFAGLPHQETGRARFEDIYVTDADSATKAIAAAEQYGVRLGIFGHTHIPTYATYKSKIDSSFNQYFIGPVKPVVSRTKKHSILFNPGSVGQPRNFSPAASYGVVTIGKCRIVLEWMQVPYDIASTQAAMRKEKLPPMLISRLLCGA